MGMFLTAFRDACLPVTLAGSPWGMGVEVGHMLSDNLIWVGGGGGDMIKVLIT